MISLRTFIQTAAAGTLIPQFAPAQSVPFVLPEQFIPQYVRVKDEFELGHILAQPRSHFLYWSEDKNKAIRYGVGVGKAGLEFMVAATIDVKKEWPTWHPTDEMIERSPKLYGKYKGNLDAMEGGPRNPLGARALYLFQNGRDTHFRIHGTT